MKRLALLTGDGYEHHYVANHLCASLDLSAIIVDISPATRSLRRTLKMGLPTLFSKTLRSVYLSLIGDDDARRVSLQRVLGNQSTDFARPDLVHRVQGINSKACSRLLNQITPDAILVYGTKLVRDHILHMANDIAFNMHTGISPYYRGTACAFWPIVNNQPHMLGATVHECTSDVDGGQSFAVVKAAIEPKDGIHEAFARCVAAGTNAYVTVLQKYLDGNLTGSPQDHSIGREYLGSMLTLGSELKARRMIRRGIFSVSVS